MSIITILAYNQPDYHGPSQSVRLRLIVPRSFIGSTGTLVQGNNASFYKEVACTVSGTTLTIPQFTLESTTDALNLIDRQLCGYSAFLYSGGKLVSVFSDFQFFKLPPTPNPTTWNQIALFATPLPPVPLQLSDFYTKDQVNALIAMSSGGGGVPTTRQVNTAGGIQGGGDLSINRTHSLTDTGVTPGPYTNTNLTVDSKGRITAAHSGTAGTGTVTSLTGGTGITATPSTITTTGSFALTPIGTATSATNASVSIDVYGRVTSLMSGSSPGSGGSDFELEQFGGAADGSTDNAPAWAAFKAHLLTSNLPGGTLRLRPGTYNISTNMYHNYQLRIIGAGTSNFLEGSTIKFTTPWTGLIQGRIGETFETVPSGVGGDNSVYENIAFNGTVTSSGDGGCNAAGNVITRTSGPAWPTTNAESIYLGGPRGSSIYLSDGSYWPIASVTDSSHLVIDYVDLHVYYDGTQYISYTTYFNYASFIGAVAYEVLEGNSNLGSLGTVTGFGSSGWQTSASTGSPRLMTARLYPNIPSTPGLGYRLIAYPGVELHTRATMRNCTVANFQGPGVRADSARNFMGLGVFGNINLNYMERCRLVGNHGHGLYLHGNDSNASNYIAVDCSDNRGWGMYDDSFLGNNYYGCHTIGNAFGSMRLGQTGNSHCEATGCYAEDDQVGFLGDAGVTRMAGTHTNPHPWDQSTGLGSAGSGNLFQSAIHLLRGQYLKSSLTLGPNSAYLRNLIGDTGSTVDIGWGGTIRGIGAGLWFGGFESASGYKIESGAADPTTSDIPAGYSQVWKTTGTGATSLWYNDSGVMQSISGGGGGGTPGGSNTQIQYNSGGSFAGVPNLTWDGTRFDIGTGQAVKRTAISSTPYNILNTDYYLGVDTSVARTLNLPNSGLFVGQHFTIADEGGTAGTNNITVSGNGANIDGASSWIIDGDFGVMSVIWTGTIWKVK